MAKRLHRVISLESVSILLVIYALSSLTFLSKKVITLRTGGGCE